MQLTIHEPLLDPSGNTIPIGRTEDGRTVVATLGSIAAAAMFRFRSQDSHLQERLVDQAVLFQQQLAADDPQPVELGKTVSCQDILAAIRADEQFPAMVKVPAIRKIEMLMKDER